MGGVLPKMPNSIIFSYHSIILFHFFPSALIALPISVSGSRCNASPTIAGKSVPRDFSRF